jgi:nicotinate (nicotinamide) nucleotide adenylyltransferase
MALAFQYRGKAHEALGRPSKIALFPGAWNPPTVAHEAIARAALGHVDEVVWLLPRAFPHKAFEGANFEQRIAMLRRLTSGESQFSVAIADGGLYFEMAEEARAFYGCEAEIALLCGRDAAERIATWDYGRPGVFDEMVDRYRLLVAGRAGDYLPHAKHADRVVPLRVDLDQVSSTEIRQRMAGGANWRELVPDSVADLAHEIYRVSPLAE